MVRSWIRLSISVLDRCSISQYRYVCQKLMEKTKITQFLITEFTSTGSLEQRKNSVQMTQFSKPILMLL